MEKELINPSEMEIKLSFHNYKLLKKEDFNLKGSHIYFVKGPNEVGKSSFLKALRSAHEIKDDTYQKVSKGEVEGINEFIIPGPDGKMYNIVYEFTDNTTRFIMFDPDGNKISKVTEMRDVFKYNHVDAKTFISWSRTADGRRKQKEHILKLLPEDRYVDYLSLEDEEESIYNKRTETNKSLDLSLKMQKEYKLTDDQIEKANNLESATTLLNKRKEEYEKVNSSNEELTKLSYEITSAKNDINNINSSINNINNDIEEYKAKILKLENERKEYEETANTKIENLKVLEDKYKELDKEQSANDSKKEQLRQSISTGEIYVDDAKLFKSKLVNYNKYKEEANKYAKEVEELTVKINAIRIRKEKIITESKFPVDNLSFDEEGYLTINGFRFDENQTCESDTILIVAQLMCKMNETPIQILGDASLLDYKKLDKLYDIAATNGKIMFVDEIDRSLDRIVVVGYEKGKKETVNKTTNLF